MIESTLNNRREFEAYARIRRHHNSSYERAHRYYTERYRYDVEVRTDVLRSAYNAWASMSDWRDIMTRNEEFCFGDQHSDKVYDVKCQRWYTEREMYQKKGVNPSQFNIIRSVLRSITGVYSSNKTTSNVVAQDDSLQSESDVLTVALKGIYNREELHKLDLHNLLLMLVTGVSASKVHYANRDGRSDVVIDYISPRQFFCDNSMKDVRYKDCSLVGCFYDVALDDVVQMFSKGSKRRAELLIDIYRYADKSDERMLELSESLTGSRAHSDFFYSKHSSGAYSNLCRVIEIWRKESAECYWVHDYLDGTYYPDFDATEEQLNAENQRRIAEQSAMGVAEEDMLLLDFEWGQDRFWKYYFLTPSGEVLDSGINPFWHEKSPIIFELHQFFDGKVYPFVTDLIDANKQINKLVAISELLVKYSAKSLLFVPIDTIDEESGFDLDYIENEYTEYDGVIPYKPSRTGEKPFHVNTINDSYGPLNVVNMFIRLSENVSGVYGALQGQQPLSGTPATMYAQQSQNSAVSLNSVFENFNSYRVRRDKIAVQLMQQFYTGKRYVFDNVSGEKMLFSHDDVKNLDIDVTVVENTDTPAYRLMINDVLMQLKQFDHQNMIDLRGMIEVGNYPFKDKLLNYLNKREEQMAQGQAPDAIPNELASAMNGYQINPELMQAMSGEMQKQGISQEELSNAMSLQNNGGTE